MKGRNENNEMKEWHHSDIAACINAWARYENKSFFFSNVKAHLDCVWNWRLTAISFCKNAIQRTHIYTQINESIKLKYIHI